MPLCHIHRAPMLVDVYGNAACERCERDRKAQDALRCRECYAPIDQPGLCPSCEQVAKRQRFYTWLGANATWITAVILILGFAILLSSIAENILPGIKGIKEAPSATTGR
jgi:uncharacterized paraquat-inducible protein A